MESLLIVFSYHHLNTKKIAGAIGKVLGAQIKTPQQINPAELRKYDLIGFGSGIYSEMHHDSLLDLADKLSPVTTGKAFLFSTNGVPALFASAESNSGLVEKSHRALREKLQSKGYAIVDEFTCPGFNTNSFLRHIGGINKGRPDSKDLERAEEFARSLKQNLQKQ